LRDQERSTKKDLQQKPAKKANNYLFVVPEEALQVLLIVSKDNQR
jgi:hypothetical protein